MLQPRNRFPVVALLAIVGLLLMPSPESRADIRQHALEESAPDPNLLMTELNQALTAAGFVGSTYRDEIVTAGTEIGSLSYRHVEQSYYHNSNGSSVTVLFFILQEPSGAAIEALKSYLASNLGYAVGSNAYLLRGIGVLGWYEYAGYYGGASQTVFETNLAEWRESYVVSD